MALLNAQDGLLDAGMLRTSPMQQVLRTARHEVFAAPLLTEAAWVEHLEAEAAGMRSEMGRLQAQIDALSSVPPILEGAWVGGPANDSLPIHPSFRHGVKLLEPFLFVGVLSSGKSRARRDAVRATWMATVPPQVRGFGTLAFPEAGLHVC